MEQANRKLEQMRILQGKNSSLANKRQPADIIIEVRERPKIDAKREVSPVPSNSSAKKRIFDNEDEHQPRTRRRRRTQIKVGGSQMEEPDCVYISD